MFDAIDSDPDILGDKPIIQGTRISVEFILEPVASSGSVAEIVRNYPVSSEHAVRQAVAYHLDELSEYDRKMKRPGVSRGVGPEMLSPGWYRGRIYPV